MTLSNANLTVQGGNVSEALWTGLREGRQTACKPGSVRPRRLAPEGVGRPFLWDAHCCAPRATNPGDGAETPLRRGAGRGPRDSPAAPIRSCSRWGLPCRPRCRGRGALLPHRFTLAGGSRSPCAGGLFSVALSLGSPPPAISRHRISVEPGLSSTGVFPPRQRPSSRLAGGVMRRCGGAVNNFRRVSSSDGKSWIRLGGNNRAGPIWLTGCGHRPPNAGRSATMRPTRPDQWVRVSPGCPASAAHSHAPQLIGRETLDIIAAPHISVPLPAAAPGFRHRPGR
jgi:hypothetical protein